jgi:hypothetical protein
MYTAKTLLTNEPCNSDSMIFLEKFNGNIYQDLVSGLSKEY